MSGRTTRPQFSSHVDHVHSSLPRAGVVLLGIWALVGVEDRCAVFAREIESEASFDEFGKSVNRSCSVRKDNRQNMNN